MSRSSYGVRSSRPMLGDDGATPARVKPDTVTKSYLTPKPARKPRVAKGEETPAERRARVRGARTKAFRANVQAPTVVRAEVAPPTKPRAVVQPKRKKPAVRNTTPLGLPHTEAIKVESANAALSVAWEGQ